MKRELGKAKEKLFQATPGAMALVRLEIEPTSRLVTCGCHLQMVHQSYTLRNKLSTSVGNSSQNSRSSANVSCVI